MDLSALSTADVGGVTGLLQALLSQVAESTGAPVPLDLTLAGDPIDAPLHLARPPGGEDADGEENRTDEKEYED